MMYPSPHKALLRPLHPFTGTLPSILTTSTNPSSNTLGSIVSLRETFTVKEVVTVLSNSLRLCHRKNIEWVEPTPPHRTGRVLVLFIIPHGVLNHLGLSDG